MSDYEPERVLGLVHTEQSIKNYKGRITDVEDVAHLTPRDIDEDSEDEDWIHSEYSHGDI